MRGRLCLIGVGLLVLSGCAESRDVPAAPLPVPPVVDLPASSAGGACRLLDYPVVEEVTGTRFDVSAASLHSTTQTCLLQSETAERPDLLLSATKTSASVEVFKEQMIPSGGRSVSGLGKTAYRITRAPARDHGAAAEVGWLTDGRLLTLRYTFAADGDRAAADAFTEKIIALAKRLDPAAL